MNCANHPERERIAFCQNCGKPLCKECARTVGTAVFCEPCLEARLTGAPTPGPAYTASGTVGGVNFNTSSAGGSYTYTDPAGNYTVNGTIPPPPPPGAPNPGLAALLGFIPGVGAMYNGQYAKGVVHLIIFAILTSLADEHGIFGLFVAGWIFYQVFEAYQTAKARRDSTPLPNPFGLNDLGERLGFGRSWTTGPTAASTAAPSPDVPPAAAYAPPPPGYPPPGAPWGAPSESFSGAPYTSPYVAPPAFDPNAPLQRNRFPAGAIWLIGLGVLFLFGNTGLFHGLRVDHLFPLLMIGLGIWLFYRRMTATGASLADDGTPYYRTRVFGALRGSVWIILFGVMCLLANFHILSWGHSWPLFIITAGIMILAERTMYHPEPPVYPVPPAPPSGSTVPPADDSTSQTFNQEGR